MATTISFDLTDTEYSVMEIIALDPMDWAENAVKERARVATNEIVQVYTAAALENGWGIPSTKEEIVADALARGLVQTAADRNAAAEAAIEELESAENPSA
jgi:hypothetical protein